jgi:hypothetical protein
MSTADTIRVFRASPGTCLRKIVTMSSPITHLETENHNQKGMRQVSKPPARQRQRYTLMSASWIPDHPHAPLRDPDDFGGRGYSG